MCCFEKTNECNSAKESTSPKDEGKEELWLEKRLELIVKFNKIQFSKLFLVPSNAFST